MFRRGVGAHLTRIAATAPPRPTVPSAAGRFLSLDAYYVINYLSLSAHQQQRSDMASASDLIATISDISGMPENSIAPYVKSLRAAGAFARGRRGPGGSIVTTKDAANLLIAVMTGSPQYCASDVEKYRSFENLYFGQTDVFSANLLRSVFNINGRHRFCDMLDAILSFTSIDEIHERIATVIFKDGIAHSSLGEVLELSYVSIKIIIANYATKHTSAIVELYLHVNDEERIIVDEGYYDEQNEMKIDYDLDVNKREPPLVREVRINESAISKVIETLAR